MLTPVVSVIIPCYNAEKNLIQCIDSVCSQTLEQIEIICVDDGSVDTTLDILQNYREQDSRIRVIRQKNAGAGAARNAGLELASGEYLSFLDADDFFEQDMLEKAVAAAEKWQADYVVFRSDRYYSAEDRYEEIPWSLKKEDLPPYMPFSYRQLTDNIFLSFVGWAWDKLFRRSFVLEHQLRFQEQRTTNDMLFVFSALVCARRIAAIQDVLAHQRRGSGDTLSVTREKSWHCFYDALLALRERLIAENVYWELEKDFINYSLHFCLWNLNTLAEPSRTLLKQKLCGEWFAELGIADKPESYFYNYSEYAQFAKIMNIKSRCRHKSFDADMTGNKEMPDGMRLDPKYDNLDAVISDAETAYAVNIEFDQLRDQLMGNRENWMESQQWYWQQKYRWYCRVYALLDDSLKKDYRKRMCQEFKRAMQLGQLQRDVFTPNEWRIIQKLISSSGGVMELLRKNPLMGAMKAYIPASFKRLAADTAARILKNKK